LAQGFTKELRKVAIRGLTKDSKNYRSGMNTETLPLNHSKFHFAGDWDDGTN
jgi:hypothetical protein